MPNVQVEDSGMRNKWLIVAGAILIGAVSFAPFQNASAQNVPTDQQVTQGELAKLLVRILDLSRDIPGEFSPIQACGMLMKNGIMPEGGWKIDEVVTRAVLARVIVQSLGMAEKVSAPEDPKAWINLLTEMNVPIATVGQAVDNLGPSAVPVAPGPGIATTDPLKKPTFFRAEDALQDGADISDPSSTVGLSRDQITKIVTAIVVPPPRQPVTPD
jgi:hypothetical protein